MAHPNDDFLSTPELNYDGFRQPEVQSGEERLRDDFRKAEIRLDLKSANRSNGHGLREEYRQPILVW